MEIPVLKGIIGRRILANYRADPDVVQSQLPPPFRPKLHQGQAIVGVCLIRLENVRPASCPLSFGFSSENAAHRIAVLWDDKNGKTQEGVFIPRRDTDSVLNHLTGGRLFPGQHHLASFDVCATQTEIDFQMRSRDGAVEVRVKGKISTEWPPSSCFATLAEASAFFEAGCLGYSVRCDSQRLDGLLLKTKTWQVQTLDVSEMFSSYYLDEAQFPKGSIAFDHALFMQNIEHEWHAAKEPGA
ncbi:MAG: DUF2071 domain-containing protein [Armatimonadota bacterium]|nr:DUF2071 domain-containing protein [Armatimonadota bacterium]